MTIHRSPTHDREQGTMRVEMTPICDLDSDRISQWRELGTAALVACPYFEADFLLPAARHLPGGEKMYLLHASDQNRMVGALPLIGYTTMGRAARRCWGTSGGILDEIADLRAPLLFQNSATQALRAMLSFLHDRRPGGAGLLDLGKLPFDSDFRGLLESTCDALALPYKIGDVYERGALVRRSTDRYWESAVDVKRARNMRRLKRQLQDQLHGELRVVDRSTDPSFIEEFIAFESRGWKGRADSGGRGIQVSAGAEHWFRAAFETLRSQDRAPSISLEIGENVLYMGTGMSSGRTMFCFRDAYDERWARFGTGFMGRLAFLELFDRNSNLDFLDSTTLPAYGTTTNLFPDRRPISSMVIAVGGMTDRTLIQAAPHARRARQAAKNLQENAAALREKFDRGDRG